MSLSIRDVVVRRRGQTILGPISLNLAATGFTIVLGPNGAGKTTLLKTMHGVERITKGALDWSVPDSEARSAQSYVFQSPVMLRRSVAENLAYPLKLLKFGRKEIEARVERWAEATNLTGVLARPAPRLSGGEQQKLALARALIHDPKVLFLDEPCANLDGRATREIETLLQTAHKNGTRMIMTTHDMGQARRLATDVLFLLNGRAHDEGPADTFFAGPNTQEAQAFLEGDIVE